MKRGYRFLGLLVCLLCRWTSALAPPGLTRITSSRASATASESFSVNANRIDREDAMDQRETLEPALPKKASISLLGVSLGTFAVVGAALADDNLEIAELPPPWAPAIFAVGLLAGVGFLTSSLGDVMSEESSLGLQSGARAKKEIERSRSSYFKKR